MREVHIEQFYIKGFDSVLATLWQLSLKVDRLHLSITPGITPSGTTVAQAELQLSAPGEQAGRCGPGTG